MKKEEIAMTIALALLYLIRKLVKQRKINRIINGGEIPLNEKNNGNVQETTETNHNVNKKYERGRRNYRTKGGADSEQ